MREDAPLVSTSKAIAWICMMKLTISIETDPAGIARHIERLYGTGVLDSGNDVKDSGIALESRGELKDINPLNHVGNISAGTAAGTTVGAPGTRRNYPRYRTSTRPRTG